MQNLFLGALMKLGLTWWLTGLPAWGIRGDALGTALAFLVTSPHNLAFLQRRIGAVIDYGPTILKPLFSVALMGVVVKVAHNRLLGITGHIRLTTLLAVFVGMLAYFIAILAVGGLKKRDFELVPRLGSPLAKILAKIGLLRD